MDQGALPLGEERRPRETRKLFSTHSKYMRVFFIFMFFSFSYIENSLRGKHVVVLRKSGLNRLRFCGRHVPPPSVASLRQSCPLKVPLRVFFHFPKTFRNHDCPPLLTGEQIGYIFYTKSIHPFFCSVPNQCKNFVWVLLRAATL